MRNNILQKGLSGNHTPDICSTSRKCSTSRRCSMSSMPKSKSMGSLCMGHPRQNASTAASFRRSTLSCASPSLQGRVTATSCASSSPSSLVLAKNAEVLHPLPRSSPSRPPVRGQPILTCTSSLGRGREGNRSRRPIFFVRSYKGGEEGEVDGGRGKRQSAADSFRPETLPPSTSPAPGRSSQSSSRRREDGAAGMGTSSSHSFNGVFLLLLLNVAAFVADHVLRLPAMQWLYLHHDYARWYQFATSTFCHATWNHLSSNLFFLYIFGRLVEEEEGSVGLWATYLVTGVGANIVSWLVLPKVGYVSVGASGAVFGLFAVSVLTRLRFKWKKLLEVVILGQFVVERLIVEARQSLLVPGGLLAPHAGVNHVAHLAGALVGVVLIWLVSKIPDPEASRPQQNS